MDMIITYLRRFKGQHWLLFGLCLGLMGFGVLAIETAARHLNGGGAVYAGKQLIFAILGLIGYGFFSLQGYRWIHWAASPLYVLSLVLLVLVGKFGVEQGGSRSAFEWFGVRFQPAQLAIAAGILMLPVCLNKMRNGASWMRHPLSQMTAIICLCMLPLLLVVMQGDMGSALVWIPLAVIGIIIAGIPFRYLTLAGLIGVLVMPWLYFFILPKVSERGAERIELYVDTLLGRDLDIQGGGFAAHYVKLSVAKGGLHGLGWHADEGSLHANRFIPWKTAHNDYIFAVIAEEHGFFGTCALILAFTGLMLSLLHVSLMSRDFTGRLLAAGVLALLFAHFFENVGMCIGLMPITGIPLPLISYGGSFLIIFLALLGIVQAVWTGRQERGAL